MGGVSRMPLLHKVTLLLQFIYSLHMNDTFLTVHGAGWILLLQTVLPWVSRLEVQS